MLHTWLHCQAAEDSGPVFTHMLPDSCYLFASLLSADIFSQIQFYSLFFPKNSKTKKNFQKNEKGKEKLLESPWPLIQFCF